MKRVIAAGIKRLLEFDLPEEVDIYYHWLRHTNTAYTQLDRWTTDDGKIRILATTQYNNSPLIDEVGVDYKEM